MMTHPDDEVLQRSLHGELGSLERAAIEAHLRECADCRTRSSRLADDEDDVLTLLRQVDAPPPAVTAEAVMARASRGRRMVPLRMAAGVVLAVTLAGVAYAVPGSPVRRWLQAAVARFGTDAPLPVTSPAASQPVSTPMSGVAVFPGESFVIRVEGPVAQGVVDVSLTDDSTLTVRAPLGTATFTSDVRRLIVTSRGGAIELAVGIPRLTPRVEVRAAGVRVFLKEGTRITTSVSADRQGIYRVPIGR